MDAPNRLRFYFEHFEGTSVITIPRSDWENRTCADGSPTKWESLPQKLGSVMADVKVVAIAASGQANPTPGIDIVRLDQRDAPFFHNTDHYTVIENLPQHPDYQRIISGAGVVDSPELRQHFTEYVTVVGPKKNIAYHWSEEIPPHIKNAKPLNPESQENGIARAE